VSPLVRLEAAVMSLSRLCALPLVLLGLSLVACGESRRPVADTPEADAADQEKKDKQEKKDDRSDKKADKDDKKDKKDRKDEPKKEDLADVHAEVTVLQVFHAFDLTAAQVKAFGELAEKTSQKTPVRKEWKVSDKYRKAMLELRSALRTGDDEKIGAATAHLDAARKDEEEPEFDEVEITKEARKRAPELFGKLNSRQVVFYLSGLGDTFPDPLEKMTEAMAQSRKLEGKEWRQLRDDVAYQAAWLITGMVDADKEEKMRDKVSDLLDKARDLNEKDYDKEKEKLEASARELVGKLSSTDIIRHYVERVLAETLSNHRLAAAVEGRQK
jgi:hypothetical protein